MIAKLLISPSLEIRVGEIEKVLQGFNLFPNHPDLLYFSNESKIGIAEARKIKEHFSFKSFNGKVRGVVLENAVSLTDEAQNALLKTLEELPEDGLFILGADSDSKLLPTVVSRCEIVILNSFQNLTNEKMLNQVHHDIEELLESSIEKRFEYIAELKDRKEFLHALVWYFHQKLNEPATHARSNLTNLNLKELLRAEEWANQNVNTRAILEYLMLVIPSKM